ncbi:hypothetical protein ONO23_00817 [Micromonospora noduli]|nr:hypothetical protein ONO23_00817 [Micromonospora noduli]
MEEMPSRWAEVIPAGYQDGKAEAFAARIDSIVLQSGDVVKVTESGVTAFVGGNNVGKSTILAEMHEWLGQINPQSGERRRVLERLEVIKGGEVKDLFAWLREHGYFHDSAFSYNPGFASSRGQGVRGPGEIISMFRQAETGESFGGLREYFAYHSQALNRLYEIGETERRGNIFEVPAGPIHRIEDNPDLMHDFDSISMAVFGQALTLDYLDRQVKIRVGRPGMPAPPVNAIPLEYRHAMAKLPLLTEQGDGMRSMLGLMLPIVTESYPVIFVDEPEAFLHPPQAFELGRLLARLSHARQLQVILATHDRNLVAGLLHDTKIPVSIVRLDREGSTTRAFQLQSESVGELTKDSILRYSNALEGLFHKLVVIAEGNDDCRFYQATLEFIASDPSYASYPPSEVLFVPSSGKHAMAKIAVALRTAGVRVVVTPDLDVFDDEPTIKKLVESIGGSWDALKTKYMTATHAFRQQRTPATCADIFGAVEAVLRPCGSEPYTAERRREVQVQMRLGESPWKALKEYGMRAFKGESRKAAEELIAELDILGLRVVRDGDLEAFAPATGVSKGPSWLAAAFAADAHQSSEAVAHVRRLVSNIDIVEK